MKLCQVEQVVRKAESLQLEYNELNKFNWNTHNDLQHLQSEHEQWLKFTTKWSNPTYNKSIIGLE
jgi:hypothetical protein